MTEQQSLSDRFGGRDGVAAIVDRFYDRVLADERLEHFFDDADVAELRVHQVQFLSSVAGGPAEYTGADMEAAHAHLAIDDDDFDIVVGHLQAALEEAAIPREDVDDILVAVERYRPAVVSNPDSSSRAGSIGD